MKPWSAAMSSKPRAHPPGPRPQGGGYTEHWPHHNGSGPGNISLNLTLGRRTVSRGVFHLKNALSWSLPWEDQTVLRVRVSLSPTSDRRRNLHAAVRIPTSPHRRPPRGQLRPSTDRQLPPAKWQWGWTRRAAEENRLLGLERGGQQRKGHLLELERGG